MSGYLASFKPQMTFHAELGEKLKFWVFMWAGAQARRNLDGTFKQPKPFTER